MKDKQADTKIPSLLAGVAGEYFVAAELSRRGHIASVSLRNTRGIDILATNAEAIALHYMYYNFVLDSPDSAR